MSLALVAPNRRRRGSRIVSESPILNFSEIFWSIRQSVPRISRDKSRTTGMDLGPLFCTLWLRIGFWRAAQAGSLWDIFRLTAHFIGSARYSVSTIYSIHSCRRWFPGLLQGRCEEIASDMSAISSYGRTDVYFSRNTVDSVSLPPSPFVGAVCPGATMARVLHSLCMKRCKTLSRRNNIARRCADFSEFSRRSSRLGVRAFWKIYVKLGRRILRRIEQ